MVCHRSCCGAFRFLCNSSPRFPTLVHIGTHTPTSLPTVPARNLRMIAQMWHDLRSQASSHNLLLLAFQTHYLPTHIPKRGAKWRVNKATRWKYVPSKLWYIVSECRQLNQPRTEEQKWIGVTALLKWLLGEGYLCDFDLCHGESLLHIFRKLRYSRTREFEWSFSVGRDGCDGTFVTRRTV